MLSPQMVKAQSENKTMALSTSDKQEEISAKPWKDHTAVSHHMVFAYAGPEQLLPTSCSPAESITSSRMPSFTQPYHIILKFYIYVPPL